MLCEQTEQLHHNEQVEQFFQQSQSTWTGFKLVGDNLDKNIHPSFSRLDRKTKSLHYFHYYAVLDRLDLSSYSDVSPTAPVDVNKLLVNTTDVVQLDSDAITLMSRYD